MAARRRSRVATDEPITITPKRKYQTLRVLVKVDKQLDDVFSDDERFVLAQQDAARLASEMLCRKMLCRRCTVDQRLARKWVREKI